MKSYKMEHGTSYLQKAKELYECITFCGFGPKSSMDLKFVYKYLKWNNQFYKGTPTHGISFASCS